MINRIIVSMLAFDLLIAVAISLVFIGNGQPIHQVELGTDFMAFMRNCSRELNDFKIEIPNIPQITMLKNVVQNQDSNWWSAVLDFFVNFANALFTFFNGLISIINFFITIINVLISVLQMIFIILKNLVMFRDSVVAQV